jgi:TPR repeat protein|eukprot:Stramenopile-MAST_4_protein_4116
MTEEEEEAGTLVATTEMYIKAAEGGQYLAQYYLGKMYRDGDGVVQDYKKAVGWLEKASLSGYADAQFSLGMLYGKGLGVCRNYETMLSWVRKAALQKHELAVNFIDSLKDKDIAVTLRPWERRIEELESLVRKSTSRKDRSVAGTTPEDSPLQRHSILLLALLGTIGIVFAFALVDRLQHSSHSGLLRNDL